MIWFSMFPFLLFLEIKKSYGTKGIFFLSYVSFKFNGFHNSLNGSFPPTSMVK